MGHDDPVYENVIVPNDRSREGRIVFAPAADLAWRCGARVVNVSNTDVSGRSAQAAVKQQAIFKTAADVEYWVDLDHTLAEATLKAVSFRPTPIICVASPRPESRLFSGRKSRLSPLVATLTEESPVPVLVVGPATDTSRGLPMTELVVVLDGTPEGDAVVELAVTWAEQLKLHLVFTALSEHGPLTDRSAVQQHLDLNANSVNIAGGVGVELVQGSGGVDDLVSLLAGHEDAVVMMGAGPVGTRLSKDSSALILVTPRALVLAR